MAVLCVFFSSRRRHTRCALVTGVQTCSSDLGQEATSDEHVAPNIPRVLGLPKNLKPQGLINITQSQHLSLSLLGQRAPFVDQYRHRLAADRKSTRLNSSH